MTRRSSNPQDETTPLLNYHNAAEGEGRWSLARRRSSAFLSFLSEPEDKDGDEYLQWQRKRALVFIIVLNTLYFVGIGIWNSFAVELVQTLACAEYYYPVQPDGSVFPTLPAAGDPSDLCSVARVDKRTNEVSTYLDTFSSLTSCIMSLVLAKVVLPRFRRRTIGIASVGFTLILYVLAASIPSHYSFDPAVPSTSTLHPTTSLNLLLALFVVGGLVGAPQTAVPLLAQVMALDVCKEDEKTSAFAQVYATTTIGMGISSILIRLILPAFDLNFSILYHTGPFSPFWMVVINFAITFVLVILFLPETKHMATAASRSRRSSISSEGSLMDSPEPSRATPPSPHSESWVTTSLESVKGTLSLFGYLLPYRSSPEAKKDYKLPLILCAIITCDTITMIWSNLVVFCSTHLHFGPKEVSTLLGVLGASKGLFSMFCLPPLVKMVHRIVKRRMRQEAMAASVESLPNATTRLVKREESVITTDRIVATGSLMCDCLGFIAMGVAASHLSVAGIYGSEYINTQPRHSLFRPHAYLSLNGCHSHLLPALRIGSPAVSTSA